MAKAPKKPQPRRKPAPAKAPAAPPFRVTHYGKNVHIVDCDPSSATGWEQWLLLRSDAHTDNSKCDRELEQKHLRQALERSAIICDLGDCLDLMQGASDRRQCKSQLRSSHAAAAYFDAVINEVAERYEPYAQHWAFLGQGNHECLDNSSEVLTRRGWVPIADVTLEDEVASMHPHDLTTTWAKPIKVHRYEYSGDMIEARQRGMSMRVTPNHRVAYFMWQRAFGDGRTAKLGYVLAEDAEQMSVVHVPAVARSAALGCKWSDDQIRLAAWVLTDGHISTDTSSVYVYQSKPKGIEEIRAILTRLGIEWNEKVRPGRCDGIIIKTALPQHVFRIGRTPWLAELVGGHDKSIPNWVHECTDEQFAIFLESYIDGDGSRRPASEDSWARVIYGTHHMLSQLQAACVTHGFRASLSWQPRGEEGYYRLNVTRRPVMTVMRKSFTRTRHEGFVYCLTTHAGNFFVRRDGIAYITGNSAWLKHHETCPTTNLVRAIKSMNPSSQMGAGGYGGWMKVRVTINNSRLTWTLRYHHGSGGGAPMSMGVLDSRRMFSWVEGADMIAVGHNHHSNIVGIAREYLETRNGVYEVRNRHCDFVRCGTYKADWGDGSGGWIVEKGPGPTSLRAKWVRLHVKWEQAPTGNGSKTRGYPRLAWDVIDAN
jgi:hypothetical protein